MYFSHWLVVINGHRLAAYDFMNHSNYHTERIQSSIQCDLVGICSPTLLRFNLAMSRHLGIKSMGRSSCM